MGVGEKWEWKGGGDGDGDREPEGGLVAAERGMGKLGWKACWKTN